MPSKRKIIAALAGAEVVLALIAVLSPVFLFPVCEEIMHCHYSFMAEVGVSVVLTVCAAATIASKGLEAARMLSAATAACGAFMILYPTWLTGVCASPKMACHYGLLPVWNLAGGVVVLLSAAVFVVAREESD